MNRPTKYQAWANGKMHEVRAISFTETGEVHRILDAEGVQRLPEALLQFTGLKDKNGTDIYDGAIVHDVTGSDLVFEVTWDVKKAGYYMPQEYDPEYAFPLSAETLEVIGNVYENPDLLAKQKKDGH